MTYDYAIKLRIYPNKEQKAFLSKNFGCCRFVYNKMIEERKEVYQLYKHDKDKLYNHKYRTEKQLKKVYPFLKEADSNSLQQARRHLQTAYKNFFQNINDRKKKKTKRYVGYPKFKSRHSKQSYTTCITNNNIKIDWNKKLLKLPKLKQWIRFKDERLVDADIRNVTISKMKAGRYFASILFKAQIQTKGPKRTISEEKIIAFDMSAKDFLVNDNFRFANPRFYRKSLNTLKRKHRALSRKKLGSNNREKAKIILANQYEKINNQKNDWTHKITHSLSKTYKAVILEDLNIEGMKQFNSGLAKSVSLDFSWHQFKKYLEYKCKRERNHLVFVNRYFASSKLCSACGYKNTELALNEREWACPECRTYHDRDKNASRNLKKEGIRILKENNITIIKSINDDTVGTTEIHAFGDCVRPYSVKATVKELGTHNL
ncbi:MAG: RNA-guided endonuclease TnpB family protein [Candidatus Hodarchaeota archaeon]